VSVHPAPELRAAAAGLPPEARREILRHVAECSACRKAYAASDPARLFGLLAAREVPAARLDEVSTAVAAAIDSGARAGRSPHGSRTARAAAAIAASLVLAVASLFVAGDRLRGERAAARLAGLVEITPPATLTLLESPGEARVMDLTMGDTQVVMIFDRELDL
jgi:predicted anti-sigma-YlaC factor YlaD